MSSYRFKNWLTIDESAEYLTDLTEKNHTSEAVLNAVRGNYLPAHFRATDDGRLGLFQALEHLHEGFPFSPECRNHYKEGTDELFAEFDGPVPIQCFGGFTIGQESTFPAPWGLTLYTAGGVIGYCYRVSDADKPVSLDQGPYDLVIHVNALNRLATLTPPFEVEPIPCVDVYYATINGDPENGGWWATSSANNIAHRLQGTSKSQQSETSVKHGRDSSAKILALAAHLIAEISDELDQFQSVASKKRNLSRAGKPKKTAIAQELSRTAERLNYEGWGAGHRGFEEALRKALRQHS